MTDVLIYWRDYRQNWPRRSDGPQAWAWHSNSRLLGALQSGDRLWMVTSGAAAARDPKQAALLAAIWIVAEAAENPGVDAAYPPAEYRFRVLADRDESVWFDEPVPVDGILRPEKWDKTVHIGRLLQGPRRLSGERLRKLRAAAGPDLALRWLTGNKT